MSGTTIEPLRGEIYSLYADASRAGLIVQGLGAWPDDVWQNFVASRRRRQDPELRSSHRREQARRQRENASCRPVGVEEADQLT